MAERAVRFAAGGVEPPAPRVAATVVIVRPARPSFQVYAIRRVAAMTFGGMYAFPGGGVDPADSPGGSPAGSDAVVGWAGHPPDWWAARLRLPAGRARAVVCAAVREVFEEAGVLLAGPRPDAVVGDVGEPRWEAARRRLVARQESMTGFLAANGLHLRSDLLLPWSRWVTPEFEPRRFDTYFFVALLPDGQRTRDVSGEADHTLWIRPAEALERHAAGDLPMLPPTAVTLRELARYADIEDLAQAAETRDPSSPTRPRLTIAPDGTPHLTL
jgi:8-oxo-dGTP pyrophosphatase MutT (NUDIX family)